jgi:hypothetical protein
MSIRKDLTGMRFGNLTVISLSVDIPYKKKKWLCRCDCGEIVEISGSNLVSKNVKGCQKCAHKTVAACLTTHGKSGTKIYIVWNGIKTRCENKRSAAYKDYGGRGIKLCEEWHDFSSFLAWAESHGYTDGMQIDRIDVNGDYCPENCRFVSRLENANNKRNNKRITHNGETKTVAEWARFYSVNYKNLCRNLGKGYTLEQAVKRMKSGDKSHRGSKAWKSNYIEKEE